MEGLHIVSFQWGFKGPVCMPKSIKPHCFYFQVYSQTHPLFSIKHTILVQVTHPEDLKLLFYSVGQKSSLGFLHNITQKILNENFGQPNTSILVP